MGGLADERQDRADHTALQERAKLVRPSRRRERVSTHREPDGRDLDALLEHMGILKQLNFGEAFRPHVNYADVWLPWAVVDAPFLELNFTRREYTEDL